jgi:hypothetical protein
VAKLEQGIPIGFISIAYGKTFTEVNDSTYLTNDLVKKKKRGSFAANGCIPAPSLKHGSMHTSFVL